MPFPYDTDPSYTGQYDDAWQTEGWTAQLGDYPDYATGPTPPAGLHIVEVVGSFFVAEGRPLSGTLTFTPEIRHEVIDGSQVIYEVHKEYMRRGSLKVRLYIPATATPEAPFVYHVRQRVGPINKAYDIRLDATMTTYDVSAATA